MSLLKVAGTTASSGTLYVDDVFSTYLYTGNGSTQTITNGIDLAGKGGLVWIKARSAANGHWLFDTSRGANYNIQSNNTNASGLISNTLNSFDSTGFSLGSVGINGSGVTHASWTFRKAAKFFDVVTFTAGSNPNRSISHSLGIAPGMIITKRIDGVNDWLSYHRSLGQSAYITLNQTYAANTTNQWWTATAPTASTFNIDETLLFNTGATYVAYLFAHDTSSTGIIQCGSFTTDGSGNATVNLGWEPQYILAKRSNSSTGGNWRVIDNMRGMPVGSAGNYLVPNTADVDSTASFLYPTATGFYSNSSSIVEPSAPYIYMAIRRPNKPPTTGTQVFGLNARTGTGANATVTGGQTDDAVLIKNRGSAVGDLFASRLTGAGYLVTSSDAAEVAAGTTILQANPWDVMDGVKVGTTSTITNASANTFINYLFKRAPGFFDEVCYTGTGVDMTLNHNLGVVPELMIVKRRSITGLWFVYSAGTTTPNNYYLRLETTGAQANAGSQVWNNTATTFLAGTGLGISAASQTYVAYLFATLAGISKVGSYTGNGTGQAIACGFSAGARFVLIKRTDAAGAWYTFDSARGLTSGSSPYLLLNSTAAEVTGNNGVYASTGGFTLGSTASTTTNINAATYIFLAVA